jgi:hypothetical protein
MRVIPRKENENKERYSIITKLNIAIYKKDNMSVDFRPEKQGWFYLYLKISEHNCYHQCTNKKIKKSHMIILRQQKVFSRFNMHY